MAANFDPLPITQTVTPASQTELADVVRRFHDREMPLYPVGGATALDYGLPAKRPGAALSLAGLQAVVDYPARDMTVTIEAGMRVAELARVLAREGQQWPIDVPRAEQATVGGVIATNTNGPRRYGYGSVRDYVIGIHAVDGTGRPFKGGGRVVKNVAGYDFCKLLTGSLGTLGVVTQTTLRLRPLPETSAWRGCAVADLETLDRLLDALSASRTAPVAIEVLTGPAWAAAPRLAPLAAGGAYWVLVRYEGSEPEVAWQLEQLDGECRAAGATLSHVWRGDDADGWLRELAEFPQAAPAPLVAQATVRPSGTVPLFRAFASVDPRVSLLAHAGNGVVVARFSEFPAGGLSRSLVGRVQPEALRYDGAVKILANPGGQEMAPHTVWGAGGTPLEVMMSVKRQFDPRHVLNPGRFVFPAS